jgi:hypothetical protein
MALLGLEAQQDFLRQERKAAQEGRLLLSGYLAMVRGQQRREHYLTLPSHPEMVPVILRAKMRLCWQGLLH